MFTQQTHMEPPYPSSFMNRENFTSFDFNMTYGQIMVITARLFIDGEGFALFNDPIMLKRSVTMAEKFPPETNHPNNTADYNLVDNIFQYMKSVHEIST